MGNETHRMSNFNIKIEELPSLEKSFRQSIDTYSYLVSIATIDELCYNTSANHLDLRIGYDV